MSITQKQMLHAIERMEPWKWTATDWRKLPNGKVARFVDWGRAGRVVRRKVG